MYTAVQQGVAYSEALTALRQPLTKSRNPVLGSFVGADAFGRNFCALEQASDRRRELITRMLDEIARNPTPTNIDLFVDMGYRLAVGTGKDRGDRVAALHATRDEIISDASPSRGIVVTLLRLVGQCDRTAWRLNSAREYWGMPTV